MCQGPFRTANSRHLLPYLWLNTALAVLNMYLLMYARQNTSRNEKIFLVIINVINIFLSFILIEPRF
jgi:hypothetical protein